MKALAKLGLLLAIIIAGRQLRPASTAALATQPTTVAVAARPDTLHYDFYASAEAIPVAPVSHRTIPAKTQADTDFTIWY